MAAICVAGRDLPALTDLVQEATALGHQVRRVLTLKELRESLHGPCDVIVAEQMLAYGTLLDVLATIGHRIPVVAVGLQPTTDQVVRALRCGAVDYQALPIPAAELAECLQRVLADQPSVVARPAQAPTWGPSAAAAHLQAQIGQVAPAKAAVFLVGESGTGKEIIAREIHRQSPRAQGPFVALNAAAIPDGLIESALFGHEKGAFTGATGRHAGAFERAHRGTLLLDEITEMRLDLQAKLLRVIQEGEVERLGGTETLRVDTRIIATSNRDVGAEVRAGRFRLDLWYRLNVFPMTLPPLRERLEDIPSLAATLLLAQGTDPTRLTAAALDRLLHHAWPGNIRELGNVLERAALLSDGPITHAHIRFVDDTATPAHQPEPTDLNLEALERATIRRALLACDGHRGHAAARLGISERTLRHKLNTQHILAEDTPT